MARTTAGDTRLQHHLAMLMYEWKNPSKSAFHDQTAIERGDRCDEVNDVLKHHPQHREPPKSTTGALDLNRTRSARQVILRRTRRPSE
ncbi:hypothetical protein Bca101_049881 [Brassica carinata]